MPSSPISPRSTIQVDWNFETEPCKKLNDHSVYLCRGKTLGGSSCTNVQLYHRGSAADYAAWVQAGATGWGQDGMVKVAALAGPCLATAGSSGCI